MGLFDSIFGIDILGRGKPDMLDDAVFLAMLEEDEYTEYRVDEELDDEDEAVMSGAIDEDFDF